METPTRSTHGWDAKVKIKQPKSKPDGVDHEPGLGWEGIVLEKLETGLI